MSSGLVIASDASLFVSKPASPVISGDKITLTIEVKSPSQSINAVSGTVEFSEDTLHVVSISKTGSVISLWTREPEIQRNNIDFEGVILNPGYTGNNGNVFNIVFQAKKSGTATISLTDGAILANDGEGTNILDALHSTKFAIAGGQSIIEEYTLAPKASPQAQPLSAKVALLPVITDYSQSILSPESIYIKGKGEPNALTKIAFQDSSQKSIGEQFIEYLETKKKRLSDVLVKNGNDGSFEYMSSSNLVAGAYNATPFLVDADKNTEKPGLGVQLLVSDSKIVHYLVILINVLGLLIPVVGLAVLIYFIPWYSWLRMRLLKKKLGLEEEKIDLTEQEIKKQEKNLAKRPGKNIA